MAWYVVYRGREPGVYATWATCHAQASGFKNCCYKSFPTKEEADASYLEFMGCEDDKVYVKPPPKVVRNTSVLFVMAVVQSFFLLVLLWFVLARCYNYLWCSKCAVQTWNDNDLMRYYDPNAVNYYMSGLLYGSNLSLDAPRSLPIKRHNELRQTNPLSCLFSWEVW